ncbi:MAG: hypothetical protein AB1631_29730, partial [Acidobacteriota bacterium]
ATPAKSACGALSDAAVYFCLIKMSDKTTSEELLVRYLLGQLSEEEQSQVEERFLSDSDYYEQLVLTEDELRCAYAKGSLARAEREQFEKRFLIYADERKKVELAQAMIGELSNIAVEERAESVTARSEEKNWRERLLSILDFRSAGMRFALAAAAAVLLFAFVWLAMETSRLRKQVSQLEANQKAREQAIEQQSAEQRSRAEQLNREIEEERNHRAQLEEEIAQLRERSGDETQPSIISLILAPGLIRGGGETKKITIKDDSAQVRLLLNIGDKSGYRNYQAAVLNSDGTEVWSRRGLRASQKAVILTVPARLLKEDDYEINLKGIAPSGELERLGDYYFTVLRSQYRLR